MIRRLRVRLAQAFVLLAACGLVHAADLELEVTLDPASRRLDAVAHFTASSEVAFPLHEALAVREATVNGRAAGASATPGRGVKQWRIPASAGAKVRIEYGGVLPALDTALDHRTVLRAGDPMVSADGTFLPAGGAWYPQPRELFTYSVRIVLPQAQRGLVPGRLVREVIPAQAGERYSAHFEFAQPSDGIDLMAGPYVVRESRLAREGAEPLRLRTYFFRDLENLADGYLEDTARYIELYSKLIGPYPFDGFSVVASPLPTGYGMAGLTYIGAQVLKLPFIRATSLGHEVLHNWWGNGVYVDYARGNWSEGLTTFMADYHYRERESPERAREMRLGWLRDYASIPAGRDVALAAFRSRTHGAAAASGYGKSAMVFFMLRDAIGEEAFVAGLRRFWQSKQFTRASWRDLQTAFEAASGRNLGAFFEQWIERSGAPRVRAARAGGAGSGRLDLVLEQTAPAYALDVPIEIVGTKGRETRRVRMSRERETATLEIGFEAHGVRVDPELRLWRALEPSELPPILRQWIVARAPRLLLASAQADVRQAADSVARAFFESPARAIDTAVVDESREPVLLAGLHGDVDAMLQRLGVAARPGAVASATGSAQVWTMQGDAKHAPIAVISARDAEALRALARPLPHYGAQSWLAFDGARAIARGVWPGETPSVPVTRKGG